ncbi:hypothetical protein HanXRQr2_Chr12g0532051 [Helianthus annuus]|uniref:Uncharacterized protein n=1 Tax=Helianthus annuus TaxID=4232 RepID=A0A9K3HF24_HELAN|nr:hypothetical protein HanXRQr2_Chr12g0532051 [Helianthus annuus]
MTYQNPPYQLQVSETAPSCWEIYPIEDHESQVQIDAINQHGLCMTTKVTLLLV